jgi:tRNA threonylcarbamoyladenosine biosynthesis protein TsaE
MKKVKTKHLSVSPEETTQIGYSLGQQLCTNSIVVLYGDLGAGKTTFIKGLANSLSSCKENEISSPTFTYLNIYEGARVLYHFDLYRLKQTNDFFALGFDEYFSCGGICCIEWPELIENHLPAGTIKVEIQYLEQNQREIIIS